MDKINSEFCFPFETIVYIVESKALYKGIILQTALPLQVAQADDFGDSDFAKKWVEDEMKLFGKALAVPICVSLSLSTLESMDAAFLNLQNE